MHSDLVFYKYADFRVSYIITFGFMLSNKIRPVLDSYLHFSISMLI